jgi:phage/plasmid-like protein (TIGR03299 family)
MSQETSTWLNRNTLIGFTDKRGHAWHYRAADQGEEPNHYPGPVPVADVKRRLFAWEAQSRPVYTFVPVLDANASWDALDDDGKPFRLVEIPGRQAITREDGDTPDVLGIFADGYERHQYADWLVDSVATILDDGLAIGSAGLLKRGGVAWVSVEVPETITTPEGVAFRPNLIAATSHDGSLSTTYQRVVTNVVCDNTMSAALAERDQRIKIRHSRYSKLRMAEARDALAIVHTIAADFAAEVAALAAETVTPRTWAAFLDEWSPMPEEKGRGRTVAEAKREGLGKLWNHDERVAPWSGTAWGVVQAVNTWTHHEQGVRGASRAERNMLRAVEGGADTLDGGTLATLRKVQVAAA